MRSIVLMRGQRERKVSSNNPAEVSPGRASLAVKVVAISQFSPIGSVIPQIVGKSRDASKIVVKLACESLLSVASEGTTQGSSG